MTWHEYVYRNNSQIRSATNPSSVGTSYIRSFDRNRASSSAEKPPSHRISLALKRKHQAAKLYPILCKWWITI